MANRVYGAEKMKQTKMYVEAYVRDNPGKKVGVAFDDRKEAKELYDWFHALPRACTLVVTYFNRGVLTAYNGEEGL